MKILFLPNSPGDFEFGILVSFLAVYPISFLRPVLFDLFRVFTTPAVLAPFLRGKSICVSVAKVGIRLATHEIVAVSLSFLHIENIGFAIDISRLLGYLASNEITVYLQFLLRFFRPKANSRGRSPLLALFRASALIQLPIRVTAVRPLRGICALRRISGALRL